MTKKFSKWITKCLISFSIFLVVLLFVELLSFLIIKYHFDLKLSYKDYYSSVLRGEISVSALAMRQAEHQTAAFEMRRFSHPIFGYTDKFDMEGEKLYYRFPMEAAYRDEHYSNLLGRPIQKEENKDMYTIGIFGGSVAVGFAEVVSSDGTFIEELKKQVAPLRKKKIRILSLAMSGSKQPQQLAVYQNFIDLVDLSVNLDGFNEVDHPNYPDYPLEWPHFSGALFFNESRKGSIKNKLVALNYIGEQLASWGLAHPIVSQRHSYFALWFFVQRHLDRLAEKAVSELSHSKIIEDEHFFYQYPMTEDDIIKANVQLWKKFTFLQHHSAKGSGKLAFFFLQPNQYIKGAKTFSEWEKNNVLNMEAKYGGKLNKAYEMMRKEITKLHQVGVKVFDLSYVFKNVHEDIYLDSCCHINKLGSRYIGKQVINIIAKELNSSLSQ